MCIRDRGDSKTPLYFLIVSSVGNIILDIIAVAVFQMGVAGVAWATLTAQGLSSIFAFVFLMKRIRKIKTEEKSAVFSLQILGQISLNAIQMCIRDRLIPYGQADLIIGFEPSEAVRCLPYLKKGGTVVVNQKAVRPVTASLTGSSYDGREMLDYLKKQIENLYIIDGEALCRKAGSAKVLNVALIGAAIGSGALAVSEEQMADSIRKAVKPQYAGMNIDALRAGILAAGSEKK